MFDGVVEAISDVRLGEDVAGVPGIWLDAQKWSGFDILLAPSSASMPWPAEQTQQVEDEPDAAVHLSAFNKIANAVGYPAISIPGQAARSGLPIGVQLVARYGEEHLLFSLARRYEAMKPWADRRPVIS